MPYININVDAPNVESSDDEDNYLKDKQHFLDVKTPIDSVNNFHLGNKN